MGLLFVCFYGHYVNHLSYLGMTTADRNNLYFITACGHKDMVTEHTHGKLYQFSMGWKTDMGFTAYNSHPKVGLTKDD